MNWEAIGAVGEIVGAAAVVITLVFLTIQMRQNTRSVDESRNATVSQLYQFRANMHMDGMLRIAESSQLSLLSVQAKLAVDGLEALTPEELMFARFHGAAAAVRLDNGLFQYENGFLDQDYFQYIETVIAAMYPRWQELGVLEMGFRPNFKTAAEQIYKKHAAGADMPQRDA